MRFQAPVPTQHRRNHITATDDDSSHAQAWSSNWNYVGSIACHAKIFLSTVIRQNNNKMGSGPSSPTQILFYLLS